MLSSTQNRIIGVTGKGGSGKTAFVSIIVKLLSGKARILAIDGDSAGGLSYTLGVKLNETIGDIRKALIDDPARRKEIEDIHIRTVITGALTEGKGFSLLAMGRAEGPGCYCGVNDLLRYGIESLSKSFDLILIDCEAGPEQINRRIVQNADTILVIVDNSIRSVQVAEVIGKVAHDIQGKESNRMGLIINKYFQGNEAIIEAAKRLGLKIFGYVPEDQNLKEYDLCGRSLLELPDTSPSVIAVQDILRNMNIL